VSDLFKLSLTSKDVSEPLSRIIQSLSESSPLEIKKTPTYVIEIDALIEAVSKTSIQSNVFDFLNSSFYLKDKKDPDLIHFVIKRDLPIDKKIIIMSATIPIEIYEKL
jgi:spore coat protein CotH